jgi:hypothetical protein
MKDTSLHDFYQHAVLPQFGIRDTAISWTITRRTEGDDGIYYFISDGISHALIFEDYDGLGRTDGFIRDEVLNDYADYEFIKPTSQSYHSPSYDGFRLEAPSRYCPDVTGTFTLVKLFKNR